MSILLSLQQFPASSEAKDASGRQGTGRRAGGTAAACYLRASLLSCFFTRFPLFSRCISV